MSGEKAIVIDSDTESGEDDVRRAIERSLQDIATEQRTAGREGARGRETNGSTPATGLAALDRKKMEQERIERQKKRAREENDTEEEPNKKRPTGDVAVTSPNPKPPELKFPKPVVKRTWAFGQSRTGEDIKIEEILQKADLQLAILSSFVWDESWLLSKVDIQKTKLMLVAYAPDDATKESMKSNVPPNVRFCFPPMYGPGAMHSKLQVLKFPNFLRIVIPTGNLMSYDWGETGVMENMVFIVDIPRMANGAEANETQFSRDLQSFLEACGIDERMVESLKHYDFSTTADLAFVYTQPGGHTGEKFNTIGYPSLASKLSTLGLATMEPIELDFICSSLGAIKVDFLSDIYRSCQGQHAPKRKDPFEKMKSKDNNISNSEIKERFRVYFPTEKTVAESRGGIPAAGTICFQQKWWNSDAFPKQIMRNCVNTRRGLLMHSKIIYVRHATTLESNGDVTGWAYVGSANFSESAWGRASQDKATKAPKLTCRNWECGVILRAKKSKQEAGHGLEVFRGILPVPIEQPGKLYQSSDQPWFFMGS